MNGFEQELRTRILGITSHATVSGLDGTLEHWPDLAAQAAREPQVEAVAPYIEEQAMLVNGARVSGALVRGVDATAEARVATLDAHLRGGQLADLRPGDYRIVLGRALAEELGVAVGDTVVLVASRGTATPAGVVPRMRRFTVAALLDAGMYEYDRGLALVNLEDAARLYRLGDRVTGLRLRLADAFAAPRLVRDIAVDLGGGFYVSDWSRKHANFFRSIAITKSIMFVILLLVVAVAAFNIVSTLVMNVREKRSDIAILRTLGALPRSVLATFMLQGMMIGLLGTLAGLLLGLLLADNLTVLVRGLEALLGTTLIDARVYFIDELPAVVRAGDLVNICGTAFALSCLATLLPSWRAARTQPATALRHD
jgi:lipoprotein-releasing system permease protein